MGHILVSVVLPLSLAFIMFSLGLGLRVSDFTNIARYPTAFLVGITNQMVILPLVGFLIVWVFGLPPMMAVGVILLALSPGGVTSNVVTRMAEGNTALSISLTAVVTLVSVITLPIILGFAMDFYLGEAAPEFSIVATAIKMFLIAIVPVMLGMIITAFLPNLSARIAGVMVKIGFGLFALIVVAAVASNLDVFTENLALLFPALIVMLLVLLGIGLFTGQLFDLSDRDQTTISIETGVQNGTLSIAVAALVMPNMDGISEIAIPAAVYGPLMYFSIVFALYRRKLHAHAAD